MTATVTETAKTQVVEKLETVCETMDHGLEATQRTWKRGVAGAKELSDEAIRRMKKEPLRTAAIFAAIGLGLGLLTGWLLGRTHRSRLF
jgi:hypothetical protein